MRSRPDSNRLERLTQEATTALETLQRILPELISEAKRQGGEELRRRILDAALSDDEAGRSVISAEAHLRAPRKRSVGKRRRGFITPAIQDILDRVRTGGIKRDDLFRVLEEESSSPIRRDSFKMALLRLAASDDIVEIDSTLFSAKHAKKATAGREGEAEPPEPASASRDLLRDEDNNAAA